jgi:HD-GYP domain
MRSGFSCPLGDRPYKGAGRTLDLGGGDGRRTRSQPEVAERGWTPALSAVADFADLKSMWTAGHSRGVADLAERAAGVAGLAATEVVALRRAALVHDIGRVAVPVSVWAKPGPLTRGEHEQVRLHAYHSERVLDVCPALRPLARLAGSHGERCDGSGYRPGQPRR